MKEEILKLLTSQNEEDIVLGIVLLEKNNLRKEIFTEDYPNESHCKIIKRKVGNLHFIVIYEDCWYHIGPFYYEGVVLIDIPLSFNIESLNQKIYDYR